MNGSEILLRVQESIGRSATSVKILNWGSKKIEDATHFKATLKKPINMNRFIDVLLDCDEASTGWRVEITDETNTEVLLKFYKS